jgi:succinyl-CoA synthetase beta subunit
MYRLLEDSTKAWLAGFALPVPSGARASDPAEASQSAAGFASGAVIKALVPTGRRGTAGAIRLVRTASQAGAAAAQILGGEVGGLSIGAVYVEERIEISHEYFLSFSFTETGPQVLASLDGGIEIETLFAERPHAILREEIDALHGFPAWRAVDLWWRCGVRGARLRALGALTARLYGAFVAGDAVLLEINPLAARPDESLCIVGAMMAVDDNALFRHTHWQEAAARDAALPGNERERRVRLANATLAGGEAQYSELDGDIGLLVGGGGAGLYVHDLVLDMGGKPANHCVTPPTGSDIGKLKEVLRAILDNPRASSLLVAFNFAQMARADLRMRALAEVLREKSLDTRGFPIVIRLFGAGETEARELARAFPGITYLPRGSSLQDAVVEIVRLSQLNNAPEFQ